MAQKTLSRYQHLLSGFRYYSEAPYPSIMMTKSAGYLTALPTKSSHLNHLASEDNTRL